jgi:hypothetical protein
LAAALVAAGVACALLVGGFTGDVLTMVLLTAGLLGAVLLIFLEVGLSEDRARARDQEGRRQRAGHDGEDRTRRRLRRRPRRRG